MSASPPLPTAAVADASVRLGLPLLAAPLRLTALLPGTAFSGPAAPVTHLGSVDAILEVIDDAEPGSVLVVDNGGRDDEACVGDLMILEAKTAGLAGAVIWGRHRDTAQLREIGLPLFSVGAHPYGPRRVPPAGSAMRLAQVGDVVVTPEHTIVADDDGVLMVPPAHRDELFEAAAAIRDVEAAQAVRMRAGDSLRDQLAFSEYRAKQRTDPALTLRRHLADRGAAVEV